MTLFQRIPALILISLASQVSLSFAETAPDNSRYITDKLYAPLRSGMGDEFPTVNPGLVSGTQVKVLEDNKASGYSHIELHNGQQGWVRTRLLISEPTAAMKLAIAEKKLSEATTGKNDSDIQKQNETLTEQNNKLTEQNTALQKQLNEIKFASANAVKLNDDNKELIKQNQLLQAEVNAHKAESDKAQQNSDTSLFFYGGLLVIATLILKTVLEGVWRRRSFNSWG